ncbi:hypothetical protein C5167_040514 [Papaver somniferum]|uniref:Uncharacterized protein n=2 Tax=Papaver somniferum TaxID=3469 RepID=A0A4Y7IIM6_PAPSO|nr:hypothetical protein C5167_040514 [Papaver somniferum]
MNFSFAFTLVVAFFLLIQSRQFSSAEAGRQYNHGFKAVPALYVFGDSLVDSGNNNYLQTLNKVNFTPYGIDFPYGATGRFTNGKTVVDFFAKWLGLPLVPPYLGLSEEEKFKTTTGINYASGAAGILPESGTDAGDNLNLAEQVDYFEKTVKSDLPKSFKTPKKISKHLSKSIFVVNIGSNDYINNYLQPAKFNGSKTHTPLQFGALLISNYKAQLVRLYSLGARKFVVFNLGPIGCIPGMVSSVTPKPVTPCVESVNNLINIFNYGIPNMIQELTTTLEGFSEANSPCCPAGSNGTLRCLPNDTTCKNRNTHLYWDRAHPVERVNYEIANGCFRGSSTCFPVNLRQLTRLTMNFSFAFILIVSFFLLIQSHQISGKQSTSNQGPVVAPALYVFGDSLVDSGNNNYLQTLAKANYLPYGVDFPNGPTGRFTNGKTTVDFFAEWLGLPYLPPYLGLSEEEKSKTITGINYASGASGILPETGTLIGDTLCLEEQVNYFERTVKDDLPKSLKTQEEISKHLSKSILVLQMGSNDYINNYLQPANYNSSRTYNPQQFSDLVISTLKNQLVGLYNLGARKFVVFELGPIGCAPGIVGRETPKPITPCLESVNNLVNIFNLGLTTMTQELASTLQGSNFIHGLVFKKSYEQNQSPLKYGYTGGSTPCCPSGPNGPGPCVPNGTPCEDRNAHLYWDVGHPVQRVNYEVAKDCFDGSSTCFPINIRQLACI